MTINDVNRQMDINDAREAVWNTFKVQADVEKATSVAEALAASGMDWLVEQEPIINPRTGERTKYTMNFRKDNNDVLGVVGKNYTPVQNHEAFAFVDEMSPLGISYEAVGMTEKGNRTWMCVKLNDAHILDDKIENYIILTNSHDGSGSMKVTMSPMRMWCHNCLSFVFKQNAARTQSLRHVSTVQSKMKEAQEVYGIANAYMAALEKEANELSKIKVAPADFDKVCSELFPIAEDATIRTIDNQKQARYFLKKAWNEDDLGNHRGTGWGLINAVADYEQHRTRNANKALNTVLDGSSLMNKTYDILVSA